MFNLKPSVNRTLIPNIAESSKHVLVSGTQRCSLQYRLMWHNPWSWLQAVLSLLESRDWTFV